MDAVLGNLPGTVGGNMALLAGQLTCNSQVTGLGPGWTPLHNGFGQAT